MDRTAVRRSSCEDVPAVNGSNEDGRTMGPGSASRPPPRADLLPASRFRLLKKLIEFQRDTVNRIRFFLETFYQNSPTRTGGIYVISGYTE